MKKEANQAKEEPGRDGQNWIKDEKADADDCEEKNFSTNDDRGTEKSNCGRRHACSKSVGGFRHSPTLNLSKWPTQEVASELRGRLRLAVCKKDGDATSHESRKNCLSYENGDCRQCQSYRQLRYRHIIQADCGQKRLDSRRETRNSKS